LEKDIFISRGLTELEGLKAYSCEIRKIDVGKFNGLTKLTHLSMTYNEITEIITGTFEKMSRLEYLDLEYNEIEHFEVGVFSGLNNLKYIDLRGHKLWYLHSDLFVGLPNLEQLHLTDNPDLQIPTDQLFISSHSLSHLNIRARSVRSFSVETFANVTALEPLDLSSNSLSTVHINILKALRKLSALYLYGNPLQCDCQLQEAWRWCQDHNIQTAFWKTAPKRDRPSEVQGMWWGVLDKGQCLQDNMYYNGDYKHKSYSYTNTEDRYKDTST
jgi:Leucine-rich repeat (LRR) protein